MRPLPEEIELYRDRKWHREDSLKVDSAEDVEAMVEELGFCLGLTDVRKMMPSVYIAVCGRRDAHMQVRSMSPPTEPHCCVGQRNLTAAGSSRSFIPDPLTLLAICMRSPVKLRFKDSTLCYRSQLCFEWDLLVVCELSNDGADQAKV